MNGINCGLNLAIFSHAARLTFPLEVRNHPTGNIPLYGFYHKLINGLAFFGCKDLNLREQFSGQRYVGVAGHCHSIIARLTVILPGAQPAISSAYSIRRTEEVRLSAKLSIEEGCQSIDQREESQLNRECQLPRSYDRRPIVMTGRDLARARGVWCAKSLQAHELQEVRACAWQLGEMSEHRSEWSYNGRGFEQGEDS
jgi:hypothetical protein